MKLITKRDGDVALWILSGEGKVLTLTEEVFRGLEAALENLDPGVTRVILTSDRDDHFCAGADIDAIDAVKTAQQGEALARRGQAILQRIEDLDIPVIAALPGLTLGGGLELALACHARVAAQDARLGLPEVRVGLLPGLGGTQRLPKLIGLRAALPLMLTGRTVNARKAKKLGLIDALAHPRHVRAVAARLDLPTRKRNRDKIPAFVMKAVAKRKIPSGYLAPRRVLRALSRGYAVEARELGQAIASPECKQLVRLFRAATECKQGTSRLALPRCVGVVGFGTMGAGIASALTRAGIEVRVKEVDDQALLSGLRRFRGDRDRLTLTTGWDGFSHAEIMIEVVPEVFDLKREVLVRMRAAAPGAMLVSNTSSLKVSELGVVGLHFFNPVHKMPLVEVVTGPNTPAGQIRRARALAVALKKIPVVVADSPGFLVNRILGRYLSAAGDIDASPDAMDAAARAFGFPMGPFEVLDIVGHDVARAVCRQLHDAYGERFAATPRFRKGKRRRAKPANLAPALQALRDEAERCAKEGVADPASIDLACAMGFGYPAWRGPILTPSRKEVPVA